MASRPILRTLMAGAAVMSLSTAAVAGDWSSYIVFGGRNLDSGQYLTNQAATGEVGFNVGDGQLGFGDGRFRATNPVDRREAIRGQVQSQMLGNALGLGPANASQPTTSPNLDLPPLPDGFNYAATEYTSEDVLASIVGTATTATRTYNGEFVPRFDLPGRTRLGLLNDPDRRDAVQDAFILLGGGNENIRRMANIEQYQTTDNVNTHTSRFETNAVQRDREASAAADDIADGAAALVGAGSGMLIVANAYDLGATPETGTGGDTTLIQRARNAVNARFGASEDRFANATRLETEASNADIFVGTLTVNRDDVADDLAVASSDPNSTSAEIATLQNRLNTAQTLLDDAIVNAASLNGQAVAARADAIERQFTARELEFHHELTAIEADPDQIAAIRTAATDTYNARLTERLRGIDGNVILVDQHALMEAVIADPGRFGLAPDENQADACLYSRLDARCNQELRDEDELLFASPTDLSTAGHKLASDQIAAMVEAPAALSGAPGVGLSSGRSISDAARDQVSREQSWKAGVSVFGTGATSRVKLTASNGFAQNDAAFHSGIVGAKYVFGNGIAVGAAGSYQLIKTPGGQSSVKYGGDGLLGTVFAGINSGPIFGSVTATYGKLNYDEVGRVSSIGAARIINNGESEGTVKGITGEAGLRLVQYDVLRAGPIANFSHWTSTIEGYTERGWAATAVRTDDLETKSTRVGFGVFMEAGGIVDGYGSLFRAKALYGHEFQDDTTTATVTPVGTNSAGSFTTEVRGADSAPFELGAEVVFGYGGVITTFGYDGIFGDISDHRFRIGASVPLGG